MPHLAATCPSLVQGLEVEVQRLINRHRAELEAAHERAAEQVKAALQGAKVEQELQLQELRDKLRKVSYAPPKALNLPGCSCQLAVAAQRDEAGCEGRHTAHPVAT